MSETGTAAPQRRRLRRAQPRQGRARAAARRRLGGGRRARSERPSKASRRSERSPCRRTSPIRRACAHVLEQAAAAHGGVDLVVNAAAAYGGDRSGPFGGGPIAEAQPDAFDAWAAAPARSAFSFLSGRGRVPARPGNARRRVIQVTGGSSRRAADRTRPLGGGRVRGQGDHAGGRTRTARAGDPRRAPDRRRRDRTARGAGDGQERPALADPRELAAAVLFLADQGARGGNPRAAGDAARRALGAVALPLYAGSMLWLWWKTFSGS